MRTSLKLLITSIFILWQFNGYAQHDLYAGSSISWGTLGAAELEGSLINKRNYSPILGGQLGLTYRWKDIVGLEIGIGQYRSRIKMNDANFEDEVDGFSLDIKNTQLFWNYSAAISVYYPIGKTDSYFYGKLAFARNRYRSEQLNKSETFEVSSADIDRTIQYASNYKASNTSLIPELGIQHKFYKGNLLSLGLAYNMGQENHLESDYSITDNRSNTVKRDRLEAAGNAFMLNVRFDFRLKHFPKREKVKPIKEQLPLVIPPADANINDTTDVVEIANRDLVIKDKMRVRTEEVEVSIWDHQTVDGDRVSLNFNGKWILENYTLKKDPYTFSIQLQEGTNTLVLHALNLGKIKPNTAALLVKEGDKEHKIVLESNLKESGTLRIHYKKGKDAVE